MNEPKQNTLTDLLDEIDARANAATPGPWLDGEWSGQCHLHHQHGHGANPPCKYDYTLDKGTGCVSLHTENQELIGWKASGRVLSRPDATFIAAARSDVPKLVKALRWYRQRFQFELGIIVPDSATKEPAIKQLMFETDAELAQLLSLPAESIPEQKTDL